MLTGPGFANSEHARGTADIAASGVTPGTADHVDRNWTPKTVSASKHASGVPNRFLGGESHSRRGYVENDVVHDGQRKDTDLSSKTDHGKSEAAHDKSGDFSLADDLELTHQQVLLEANKVRAKFVSNVDTNTEVILRFDFINSHDTRVS